MSEGRSNPHDLADTAMMSGWLTILSVLMGRH